MSFSGGKEEHFGLAGKVEAAANTAQMMGTGQQGTGAARARASLWELWAAAINSQAALGSWRTIIGEWPEGGKANRWKRSRRRQENSRARAVQR